MATTEPTIADVISMNTRLPMTPELRSHKILASIRAVHALHRELVQTDVRMHAVEKEKLSDATKAYREIIRDAEERGAAIMPKEAHEILPRICEGLRTRDKIHEANQEARKARKAERARVTSALEEFEGPSKETNQAALPLAANGGAETGLEWFSDDARAVAYTALLDLDGRGKIDAVQSELLGDLAAAGLSPVDFVLDAAEAIEDAPPEADDVAAELAAIADEQRDLPI